jgi:hypothetical protein
VFVQPLIVLYIFMGWWRARSEQTLTGYVNAHLNTVMLCYTFAAVHTECVIGLRPSSPPPKKKEKKEARQTPHELPNPGICLLEKLRSRCICSSCLPAWCIPKRFYGRLGVSASRTSGETVSIPSVTAERHTRFPRVTIVAFVYTVTLLDPF